MPRKPHAILLAAAALALISVLALPESGRARLRLAFGSLFLPLFGVAGTGASAAKNLPTLAPRAALEARIEALERTNRVLGLALAEARAAVHDADRLRQMAGYPARASWRLRPARVVGRDPANWWQSVHLDVGQRAGITTNLAVLTPEGLVGRVAEVSPWTCRVLLVGDPNCPVSASLADTGETGILRGGTGGDIQGALVDLSYLPRSAAVKPGQRVVTSGQGGVFPPGIAVGDVVDARPAGLGVYVEARVRLAVNLAALDHVWVKLP